MLNSNGRRMLNILTSLGIYNTAQDSAVFAELYAVSVELGLLKEVLDKLLSESFVQTAEDFGLSLRELQWGKEKTDVETSKRRQMILNRHKLYTNCPSLEKLYSMMTAYEFFPVFTVHDRTSDIDVTFTDELTDAQKAEMKAILRGLLPVMYDIDITYQG